MKKLFTLLCTMVIVLSASAAPKAVKKCDSLQKTQVAAKTQVQPKAEKNVKAVPVRLQKNAKSTAVKRMAKAPQAKQETINEEIIGLDAEFDSDYNVFTYMLASKDVYFFFSFPSEGEDVVELGKTYTLEDMDEESTYWYVSSYEYGFFEECTFVKTVNDGKVKIEVSATDTYGDVWNLLYDEASLPELPNGGTFVADYVGFSYYDAEEEGMPNDVYYSLEFNELNLEFQFDIYVEDGEKDIESGKTYTLENMWLKYSNIIQGRVKTITFVSAEFKKTVAEDGSYIVEAVVVDENENTWNISASKAAPKISQETLTLDGIIESSYFQIIEAANADSSVVVLAFLWADSSEGEFTDEDFLQASVLFNGIDYEVSEAAISIVYNEEAEAYFATGTLTTVNPDDDLDIIIFTLNLKLLGEAPAVVVPVDMTFEFQNTGSGIVITPSNDEDPWDWYIIEADVFAEQWDSDADDIAEAAYSQWGDLYAEAGASMLSFETLLAYDYEPGEYILVVWGCNGGITTPAVTFAFSLWAQGIENTEAGSKAIKTVRDGQLIIIRNGLEFNAQGAVVK